MNEVQQTSGAKTVSTLLCHDHVDMGIDCLGSMQRNIVGSVKLRIHDDGTLTSADKDRLASTLSGVKVIDRDEADERVARELGHLPAILALRKTFPLALKAVDCVLWCDEDIFAFSDSDVFYMRPTLNPFRLESSEVNAVYMQDRAPSYSMRSYGKVLSPSVKLPAMANTGTIVFRQSLADFEFFDWFIQRRVHGAIPWVLEQTYWAALGMQVGCAVLDPERVMVMRDEPVSEKLTIGHFTAQTRHLLPNFVEQSQSDVADREAVQISIKDAGTCTALDLFKYEVRRVRNRLGGTS